MLGFQAYFQ